MLVAPGTYEENIDFKGKAIVVRSDMDGAWETHDIAPETTIIRGNRVDYCVRFDNHENRSSVIRGFTITNGDGGILCSESSPEIKDNIMTFNYNYNYLKGGAIVCISTFNSEPRTFSILMGCHLSSTHG